MDDHRLEDRALDLDLRIGEGFEAAHSLGVPPVDPTEWQERLWAVFLDVEDAVRVRAAGLSIADLEALRSGTVRQLEATLDIGEEHVVIDLEASTRQLVEFRHALAERRAQLEQTEGSARDIRPDTVPLPVMAGLSIRVEKISWGDLVDRGLGRVKRASEEAEYILLELRGAVRRVETAELLLRNATDVKDTPIAGAVLSSCLTQPSNPYYDISNEVRPLTIGYAGRGGKGQGLWQVIGPWVLNRMSSHQESVSGFDRISKLINRDIKTISDPEKRHMLSISEASVLEEMSDEMAVYNIKLSPDQLLRIRRNHNIGLFGDSLRPEEI